LAGTGDLNTLIRVSTAAYFKISMAVWFRGKVLWLSATEL
jgi:hypothetical protein